MNLQKYKRICKDGKTALVKISKHFQKGKVIVKFKYHKSCPWMYHIPKYKFDNKSEIEAYLIKHLESDFVIFKVESARDIK
jgi:ribosomal protein L15